jgi:hypothetical protein
MKGYVPVCYVREIGIAAFCDDFQGLAAINVPGEQGHQIRWEEVVRRNVELE